MELLVIYVSLDLVYDLLGSRSGSILCLRQLLHRCWVHMVNLSTRTYYGASLTLLCIYYRLCLRLCLSLSNLQVQSLDLIHQSCDVLICTR